MDGKREKTRGLSLFSLSLHLSPFHTKRNSQHVGRHDLQADGHVRDALVGPRSARRLGLDLRLDRPEISEPVARPVQELGPLGSVAAGLGPAIRGAAGPDELEDEGAASADVGAAGQEVAADLRGERGGLSFCCGGGGGAGGAASARRRAPALLSPPSLSHQRLQHARLARALGANDRDLGQVHPQVEVDLVEVGRGERRREWGERRARRARESGGGTSSPQLRARARPRHRQMPTLPTLHSQFNTLLSKGGWRARQGRPPRVVGGHSGRRPGRMRRARRRAHREVSFARSLFPSLSLTVLKMSCRRLMVGMRASPRAPPPGAADAEGAA